MKIMKTIDLKHHIEVTVDAYQQSPPSITVDIIKSGNGQPIPLDEPIILFRGRDRLAVPLLEGYKRLCEMDGCNDFQLGQVNELIKRFRDYGLSHPEVLKQPGVTRGK